MAVTKWKSLVGFSFDACVVTGLTAVMTSILASSIRPFQGKSLDSTCQHINRSLLVTLAWQLHVLFTKRQINGSNLRFCYLFMALLGILTAVPLSVHLTLMATMQPNICLCPQQARVKTRKPD
jgi:hypothetical protein